MDAQTEEWEGPLANFQYRLTRSLDQVDQHETQSGVFQRGQPNKTSLHPVGASTLSAKLHTILSSASDHTLPAPETVSSSTSALKSHLPSIGLGEAVTGSHLLEDVVPGLNGPKTSNNYYGFVTGGVLPIAELADNIVTAFDQNVAVHLPDQSVSTTVEDRALQMLLQLLSFDGGWNGRTFTTGATASNVLGLACGREAILTRGLVEAGEHRGVGELGILKACARAGVTDIQILTTLGHSSLYKAASVVGIGRASVKLLPESATAPWKMNTALLEDELRRSERGVVNIVVLSAGEVNTGRFATDGLEAVQEIRNLCNIYGAWLHADGAFGIFARALPPTEEFATLRSHVAGLELVDSIAGDCHKLLNVPYDCGFFLTRSSSHLSSVFQNPNAAYLATLPSKVLSPLNIGLENSRRFRALPVYAVLLAYGRTGLAEMFALQVRFARKISDFIYRHVEYELLPKNADQPAAGFPSTFIVVLFKAKDKQINLDLVRRVNAMRVIYVSGTMWEGEPACRIAISTWKVSMVRDMSRVTDVLERALVEHEHCDVREA